MSDLEQALNGEVEPEAEQAEAPAEAAPEETGQPETTEPTGEEQSSPPEDNEIAAFKAKAIDETRKRQELEQKYNQLQSQFNQPQEKPDFWQDPDQAISQITQEFDTRLQQANTNMSVQIMRSLHDDYDEKEAAFIDMANKDRALIMQMNQSGNPAKFAYDYVNAQQQLAEMQDPSYKEKLKAELRAEIEREKNSEIEQEIRKRSELPGSLANDRAAGGNTAVTTARPELEKLIGN